MIPKLLRTRYATPSRNIFVTNLKYLQIQRKYCKNKANLWPRDAQNIWLQKKLSELYITWQMRRGGPRDGGGAQALNKRSVLSASLRFTKAAKMEARTTENLGLA